MSHMGVAAPGTRRGTRLHRVPVVAHPVARLHDDQIEPQRQVRQQRTVGQRATLEKAVRRRADARALPVVDGLFGQAEVTTGPPADLDGDQLARRSRVDRHEIQLVTADVDVPRQDRPASRYQPLGDQRLRGVA
jgi:hypothetical protein